MCWSNWLVPSDYFHPVCVSCLWARCMQYSKQYSVLRLQEGCCLLVMFWLGGTSPWHCHTVKVLQVRLFHSAFPMLNSRVPPPPHGLILFSGKHFHPLENLSCFCAPSWCQSWGGSSQNHRHYSNCSQTTALGEGTIRVTFGFCSLMLATFILAPLTARSSGTCWHWPKIWTVMNSLATVFTWAVYNLVKETNCEQEDHRIGNFLPVRVSWVYRQCRGS